MTVVQRIAHRLFGSRDCLICGEFQWRKARAHEIRCGWEALYEVLGAMRQTLRKPRPWRVAR